jgi:hypothetical protein
MSRGIAQIFIFQEIAVDSMTFLLALNFFDVWNRVARARLKEYGY